MSRGRGGGLCPRLPAAERGGCAPPPPLLPGAVVQQANSLLEVLEDDDQDYDDKEVFVAVYDPPQKLLNRHNELHVVKAVKKVGARPASA